MAFNEEQFIRDILGATGGKVTIEKGTLNKSFEEMKEDLEKVFKPKEPLFTLTAEEVEIVKVTLEGLKEFALAIDPNLDLSKEPIAENLLARIKEWEEIQK